MKMNGGAPQNVYGGGGGGGAAAMITMMMRLKIWLSLSLCAVFVHIAYAVYMKCAKEDNNILRFTPYRYV